MNIRETEHLTVWFHDIPPARLPAVPGPAAAGIAAPAAPGGRPAGPAPPAPEPAKAPKKPINLWAQAVVVHVNRAGPRNELDRLVTRGGVHVKQDGATPTEKGVDITGENLELLHHIKGDLLVVHGEARKFAELQLGELFLAGLKVTIDQKENTAVVDGNGAMNMPSNTSLEGSKPAKPGTRLRVFWNEGMFFDGKEAAFRGGVQAFQDTGRLKCQVLQVVLDRAVSFKEGQKDGQKAKVENLVCDKSVYVEDIVREKGKLAKYSRLVCQVLSADNVSGKTSGAGPGIATVVQKGTVDSEAGGQAPKPARGRAAAPAKTQEEMKLTRVEFTGTMNSTSKPNVRTVTFYDNVEVVNVPTENPDLVVNKDRLPLRGMFLTCATLTLTSTTNANGKVNQHMLAKGNVFVTTPEFQARSYQLRYDEAKDQVILEGDNGGLVTLYKIIGPGKPPQMIQGTYILYDRRTGAYWGDGLRTITGVN
jgi:hypothetical protein